MGLFILNPKLSTCFGHMGKYTENVAFKTKQSKMTMPQSQQSGSGFCCRVTKWDSIALIFHIIFTTVKTENKTVRTASDKVWGCISQSLNTVQYSAYYINTYCRLQCILVQLLTLGFLATWALKLFHYGFQPGVTKVLRLFWHKKTLKIYIYIYAVGLYLS